MRLARDQVPWAISGALCGAALGCALLLTSPVKNPLSFSFLWPQANAAVPTEVTDERKIAGVQSYGCFDPTRLERLQQIIPGYDDQTAKFMLNYSVAEGQCVFFQHGEVVTKQHRVELPRIVQVVRHMDGKSYWLSPLSLN